MTIYKFQIKATASEKTQTLLHRLYYVDLQIFECLKLPTVSETFLKEKLFFFFFFLR